MSKNLISRRTALLSLAAALAPVSARAQDANVRFRAIEVDVRPLRENGDTHSAEVIAAELPGALRAALGAHLAPGDRSAPILRARIDTVYFGAPGSAGNTFDRRATHDNIDGAGVLVGPGGRVLGTYPLTATLLVHPNPDDITGADGHYRIVHLAQAFAQWLPGKLGI